MSDINKISEELLLAVKTGSSNADLLNQIAVFPIQKLESQLESDIHKKSFWINNYNSFFQILRKERNLTKPEIYRGKHVLISGKKLSLDDIEHGILRRFRSKFSLGYLPNPFTSSWLKKWAVNVIDYRIHFALNCGAKSCPPIAFYSPEKLDQQLELATASFLEGDSEIGETIKELHVTSLFRWFSKDFGGSKGTKEIVSRHLKKDFSSYKLVYKDYSWEEMLNNFDEGKF